MPDPEAVLLPIHPDSPVHAVRSVIGDVLPEIPEHADGFTPHVSVAYSASDGPAGPVFETLDERGFAPAHARIAGADLIVIHRDNRMYEWEPFASVPLGQPQHSG
ncbi:2'-5' RNA ligase family protein [Streptomyces sp. NPDC059575]|uniref:2'-5' RNA ligase family protein n=1 Tax=Streptomyces sp. NPDC059575 TaxID=3346872 RepID=UPI00368A63A1